MYIYILNIYMFSIIPSKHFLVGNVRFSEQKNARKLGICISIHTFKSVYFLLKLSREAGNTFKTFNLQYLHRSYLLTVCWS